MSASAAASARTSSPGARAVNRRLLDTERVGQGCVLASPAYEADRTPHRHRGGAEGRRAPALRFTDPRVQALAGPLATTLLAVTGISDKSLRALLAGLLGQRYTMSRASYDLTRLRRNGLIERLSGRNNLPAHARRPRLRDLLHQGAQPGPAPAAGHRRRPARAPTAQGRPTHHRPARPRAG
jgi:hypothetical protein